MSQEDRDPRIEAVARVNFADEAGWSMLAKGGGQIVAAHRRAAQLILAAADAADRSSGYLRVPVEGLRELLAKALHASDCGCGNGPDPWYLQLADAAQAALLIYKAGGDQ